MGLFVIYYSYKRKGVVDMEIKVKQNSGEVFFTTVKPGQVFVYDEYVYMRLADTYSTYDHHGDFIEDYNAICLSDGDLFHISDCDVVLLPIKIVPMEVTY